MCDNWFEDSRWIDLNTVPRSYCRERIFVDNCRRHKLLNGGLNSLPSVNIANNVNNYLEGCIDNRKISFLVDTGADISLLSILTFEKLDNHSYKILPLDRFHILGVGKAMQNVNKKIMLTFCLGNIEFNQIFLYFRQAYYQHFRS